MLVTLVLTTVSFHPGVSSRVRLSVDSMIDLLGLRVIPDGTAVMELAVPKVVTEESVDAAEIVETTVAEPAPVVNDIVVPPLDLREVADWLSVELEDGYGRVPGSVGTISLAVGIPVPVSSTVNVVLDAVTTRVACVKPPEGVGSGALDGFEEVTVVEFHVGQGVSTGCVSIGD